MLLCLMPSQKGCEKRRPGEPFQSNSLFKILLKTHADNLT